MYNIDATILSAIVSAISTAIIALLTFFIVRLTRQMKAITESAPNVARILSRTDAVADEKAKALMRTIDNAFEYTYTLQNQLTTQEALKEIKGDNISYTLAHSQMLKANLATAVSRARLHTD